MGKSSIPHIIKSTCLRHLEAYKSDKTFEDIEDRMRKSLEKRIFITENPRYPYMRRMLVSLLLHMADVENRPAFFFDEKQRRDYALFLSEHEFVKSYFDKSKEHISKVAGSPYISIDQRVYPQARISGRKSPYYIYEVRRTISHSEDSAEMLLMSEDAGKRDAEKFIWWGISDEQSPNAPLALNLSIDCENYFVPELHVKRDWVANLL